MALRNAHELINEILKPLFAAETRRINNWIDRMCRENKEAYRGELKNAFELQGFIFNGVFYRPSDVKGVITGRKALHYSLWGQMEALEKDKKIVDSDRDFIRQAMVMLLIPCKTLQDVRDTLPECLVDLAPSLKQLPRLNQPGFTIEGNPRALKQYEKMLPKIQVYAAARMIY